MKISISEINKEYLRKFFIYQPANGLLRWRVSRSRQSKRLDVAGKINFAGYREVMVEGRSILAHRIAFFWVHGFWPEQVDHKNRCRSDNSISNLRPASQSQNQQNQRLRSTNTSGIKGVCWDKRKGLWYSRVGVNGKVISLGYYEDKFSAACAVFSARNNYHGVYCNHGN
ncbi:HNH endonuclease [Pantoea dispersa]|uniref:HNH endonuclease n=1 Tax=Pantoea dispersa TaxID=59814 RepID=UPI0024B7A03B|nr:HNH endonuclease [Pantoea dispersa]MDI9768186.1 HNH endonuclease [Pantoea dispersa]